MRQLNIGGRLLTLDKPIVMGILNVTSNSFFDGGRFNSESKALKRVEEIIDQGANIIDIGGFSSSPQSKLISANEELEKLQPIVKAFFKEFPDQILSIDTYRAEVVERLSEYGPFIVNDISGFQYDESLIPLVSKLSIPYILMHMKGTPETMTSLAQYDDVCFEVLTYLSEKIHFLRNQGVEQIIVDPGFGFAKNIRQNFEMLRKLKVFKILEYPLLAGISRKSLIYKTLQTDVEDALNGTTALHMAALINGADILRVHDVREAIETIRLWSAMMQGVND